MAVVVLLLILSALVSAVGTAIITLSPESAKGWDIESKPAYRRILAQTREPEILTATMQIADLLLNVIFVVFAAHTAVSMVTPDKLTAGAMVLISVIIVLLLLIFGEIVPRMYASQHASKVISRWSFLLAVFQKVLYPLSEVVVWSTSAVHKARKKQSISIDDLNSALKKTSETSETSENENILKGIVKFGSINVHTIMTPRMDVESIDIVTGLTELIVKINEWGYSRIPVYDDVPDNVKGILYVKDLLPYIDEKDDFAWQKLIRDAYFVTEYKKIDDLLMEFQEMKIHMAVIIDEYGGMAGIVTLEDILEEIVGEIADESDDDEQDYVKLDEHTYLFDGKVLLNDFFRIVHLDESNFDPVRGEADTLAGVILEIKGEIPQKGDRVDYMHLSFFVESVDNRRIKQIKLVIHESEEK